TPPGAVTVVVLTRVPVAPPLMLPEATNVTTPPGGRSTTRLMFPAPPPPPQLAPPEGVQVQVIPVMDPGKASATVAPLAWLGPRLAARMVYVTTPPGVAEDCPSVFEIRRSAS